MGQSDSGKFSATKVKKAGVLLTADESACMFVHKYEPFLLTEVLDLIKEETQFLLDMKASCCARRASFPHSSACH